MNIWICESSVQSGCHASSQSTEKQQRIDDSKQCLELFNRNKSVFLRRYVTMDETWLHHFTPESNRQSAEWTARDEPTPKCGKTQKLAYLKRMLAGQKFCADEEIIAETEAYFKAEVKLYYKNGIEKLYGHYNRCIALEVNYIE
ncbi:putative DD34D transposase [Trichonephila clavipes]|nr:putative DD34D transposase [Trichonephila clavipes]